MSLSNSLILKNLDELNQDDFERFKLYLTSTMEDDFEPIPRSKLEKAKQVDVVQLMVSQYGAEEAANITVNVLKKIGQNHLANDLEKKLNGNVEGDKAQAGGVDGASSSSSSSQAAGVSQSMSAGETGTIQAPVLSGGHYHGPVTMNFHSSK